VHFTLRLPDGRDLQDEATQILAADAMGFVKLMAYTVPDNVLICGHYREEGWSEFLADAGYSTFESLAFNVQQGPGVFCRLQTAQGIINLRTTHLRVYSDNGDPMAAAIWDNKHGILCAHCCDDDWPAFCKSHKIQTPRALTVVELN